MFIQVTESPVPTSNNNKVNNQHGRSLAPHHLSGLKGSGIKMSESIVLASCDVYEMGHQSNKQSEVRGRALCTVLAQPSTSHAFSRISLRVCRFLYNRGVLMLLSAMGSD